jgi:hypothetical protein|tara:strand:- start:1787 stop:1975 length:189 start_codon:yes stop_codon:yes gene_type:complete
MANTQLTPIQLDYKQHITNTVGLRDSALSRLTQIRKEVTKLHLEESTLEDMIKDLESIKITR